MRHVLLFLTALATSELDLEQWESDENQLLQVNQPPRRPVIIDTDMDLDDMMAVAYLLAEPSIEVKAITVSAVGWSHQYSGVVNAMRLTEFFGQPDIPVGYSSVYVPDTQLNLEMPNLLPRQSLLSGIDQFFQEYVPLPFNIRPPSWMYGPQLITRILRTTRGKVDIIELGPLQAIARVLQDEPLLLQRKVGTFYMSGGIVQPRNSTPVTDVWPYEVSNISYTGDPPGGVSWNIFSDPISANAVFSYGLRVVLATKPMQNNLTLAETDTEFIPASCPEKRSKLLQDFLIQIPNAANQNISEIKYWDQSAAVLAVQMINNGGAQEADVCVRFDERTAAVMLEASDNATTGGGQYARILENRFGNPFIQCLNSDITEFKTAYYQGVCR